MISINGKQWDKLTLSDIEEFLKTIDDDETFFIEYKTEDVRKEKLLKEMVAFSNSYGGYILLGVNDSKEIIGCSSSNWNELRINTIVCNGISPMPQFDIKKFNLSNCKSLFIIKVEEGTAPPYVTNTGKIYQRVSSSSDLIKNSNTLNNLYLKKQNNIKMIEEKLYYPAISGQIPDNLCAYIDFGFSLITKNLNQTIERVDNANIDKISELLKSKEDKYSISKIGYSICISVGETSVTRGNEQILTTGGLANFMEILPDGSFRCRVLIISKQKDNVASISSITLIYSLFADIYEKVFGDDFAVNFIEAYKYEKLTVLRLFQPKILVNGDGEFIKKIDDYYKNHVIRYGGNMVISNNRVPMTGFINIDKSLFELNKVEFNSKNLYQQLFYTNYAYLGYFDDFPNYSEKENK